MENSRKAVNKTKIPNSKSNDGLTAEYTNIAFLSRVVYRLFLTTMQI